MLMLVYKPYASVPCQNKFVKDVEKLQKVIVIITCLWEVCSLIRNDISDFDRTVTGYFKADPQRVEAIRND